MTLTLTIEMDNAAFVGANAGAEAARILRAAARQLDGWDAANLPGFCWRALDTNGNKVGKVEVAE